MMKGILSFGKCCNKTHTIFRRCGRLSCHIQKSKCAQGGCPAAKLQSYHWSVKAKCRKTTGTGHMRRLKIVKRRFRNGFRERRLTAKRAVASSWTVRC
ncbi:60S ribosomal protein L37-like [Galleria mellonella]|uniref:60S ribosomal protein L37-like n=1 Tax=Galleria mellonella TaxID=7137 RepID=A0ABM3MI83_GALME|nr:60S ribosomal protein L37-like [Galleria mellonella]